MRIGILYNLIDEIQKGKDIEKLADNEVLETAGAVKKALESEGHSVALEKVNLDRMDLLKDKYDIIFNLAEGIDGDPLREPEIAVAMEKINLPFTGAGSKALELCLHKIKTKKALLKNNIPTPNFQIFKSAGRKRKKGLEFPLIIKPAHEDGSIGITPDCVVHDDAHLKEKVGEIIKVYKQPALVEEYIDGREINAALLGNGLGLKILPLSEIVFDFPDGVPKIVSFEAKWVEDSLFYKKTIGKCPADLPQEMVKKIEVIARKAFIAAGCNDYGRVDLRLRGKNERDEIEALVLEVNPNPCINPKGAGFIRSANAAGYSYDKLVNKIVELAVERSKKSI